MATRKVKATHKKATKHKVGVKKKTSRKVTSKKKTARRGSSKAMKRKGPSAGSLGFLVRDTVPPPPKYEIRDTVRPPEDEDDEKA